MVSAGAAVRLTGVGHRFGDLEVLQDIDLQVPAGRSLGVIGPSGCGKSTLLSFVSGLDDPAVGTVTVGSQTSAAGRLSHCALMPQRDLLLPWLTAVDNAALALTNRGLSRAAARAEVTPLFERFGLAGFELRRPAELSGGMRQRVAFLRTLAAAKDVLLLDEPFGGLDAITRGGMQDWLRGVLRAEPRTTLLVTHDVEEALLLCDQVVVLSGRPARVLRTVPVEYTAGTTREDTLADPAFVALRTEILRLLANGHRR
ncbi:ABC transporter ATP-binding protein [Pseudonocardiaceae bacterium YIM PH 21723]|nr:ABC transporter ATP-binding protein [Pseudonocardiaceae bacterium YIM PH 21723]